MSTIPLNKALQIFETCYCNTQLYNILKRNFTVNKIMLGKYNSDALVIFILFSINTCNFRKKAKFKLLKSSKTGKLWKSIVNFD